MCYGCYNDMIIEGRRFPLWPLQSGVLEQVQFSDPFPGYYLHFMVPINTKLELTVIRLNGLLNG